MQPQHLSKLTTSHQVGPPFDTANLPSGDSHADMLFESAFKQFIEVALGGKKPAFARLFDLIVNELSRSQHHWIFRITPLKDGFDMDYSLDAKVLRHCFEALASCQL